MPTTDLGGKNEISLSIYLARALVSSMRDADLFVTEAPAPPAERGDHSAGCACLLRAVPWLGNEEERLIKLPWNLGALLVGILQFPNRFWNNKPSLESSGRDC